MPPARASVGAYWRDRLARGRAARGAGDARDGCGAGADRPEPRPVVALQHRQPVRGVLVPREPRRGAGAGRARVFPESQDDRCRSRSRASRGRTRAGRWARSSLPRPSTRGCRATARFLARATPTLAGYVAALGAPGGLAGCSRRSTSPPTSPTPVQGLHAQAVAWQGLRAIAAVWAAAGRPGYAARRAAGVAGRLGAGLRARGRARRSGGFRTARSSCRCGSAPARSRTARVTESREGSYWNLVAPYALASGLFPPGSRERDGSARLPRACTARCSSGSSAPAATRSTAAERRPALSGTDEVYGVNLARFLAARTTPTSSCSASTASSPRR